MTRLLGIRLVQTLGVLVAVSVLAFLLVHFLPGDPAQLIAGEAASPEAVERIRGELGLDRPLLQQYGIFLGNTLRGDLGASIRTHRPVATEIRQRLWPTLILATAAMLLATLFGIALGLVAGWRSGRWIDVAVMTGGLIGFCIPSFWLGLMLILLFSNYLSLLPSVGFRSTAHLVLPAVTLAAAPLGMIARLIRGSLMEVIRQDFVRTARSKGLPEFLILTRHALRNAMVPTVTMIGLQFGLLLGGAVITESIFSWPGLGRLLVESVLSRDFPIIRALILLFAAIFSVANLLVDLVCAWLDPRVREA